MMKKKIVLYSVLAFLVMAGMFGTVGISYAAPTFPINVNTWVPIALIIALLVIVVAAVIYMLSGIVGNNDIRAWSQNQLYQTFITIILLLVFAAFTYLFFLNPQGAFGAVGLVPAQCNPQNQNPTTIYTLATCDISTFTTDAFQLSQVLYFVSYFLGASPGIAIKVEFPNQPYINTGFSLDSFVPSGVETVLGYVFDAVIFTLILNQIQVILIAAALLLMSIFIVVGLLARTFGVTRTFGGAMIALALGFGLVYPLLAILSYGFIDTNICSSYAGTCTNGTINTVTLTENVFGIMIQTFTTAISSGLLGNAASIENSFVIPLAYLISGLTFIPFINFTILDAFVIDFSKSLGQEISFTELLGMLV